jgi:hypothetical protein
MTRFAILLMALGCGGHESPAMVVPEGAVQADTRPRTPRGELRGYRRVGCRETLLRMSLSMCEQGRAVVPAPHATAEDLWVASDPAATIDECLKTWQQLEPSCPPTVDAGVNP